MIVYAQSGHTMFIQSSKFEELPEDVKKFPYVDDKEKFYIVKNSDKNGVVFMYIAKSKGNHGIEYVVWYRSGNFWSGYGTTIKEAIDGAQKDGWLYA